MAGPTRMHLLDGPVTKSTNVIFRGNTKSASKDIESDWLLLEMAEQRYGKWVSLITASQTNNSLGMIHPRQGHQPVSGSITN